VPQPAWIGPLERRHAAHADARHVARAVVVQERLGRDRLPLFLPDVDQVAVRVVDPDPHLRRIFRRVELRDASLLDRGTDRLEIVAGGREGDMVQPLLWPFEEQQLASTPAGLELE